MLQFTYKAIRRVVVIIIGFTVILAGVIMLVTPGPGMLAIVAGLGILASELLWARSLLHRLKHHAKNYSHGLIAWLQRHLKAEEKSPPQSD
jgi:uncharacterized protein (TIGR02611 family)